MVVVVDVKLWLLSLTACSAVYSLALVLWYKRRREFTLIDVVALVITSAVLAPLVPILSIAALPILLERVWLKQS